MSGVRPATPARRTSPAAHREDRSRSASGKKASASSPRGSETSLDRPGARCPGAAFVKNRLGDLLAYAPGYERLDGVCLADDLVFGSSTGVASRPPATTLVIDEDHRVALEGLAASQATPHRLDQRAKALCCSRPTGWPPWRSPRHLSEPLGDVLRQTYGRVQPVLPQSRLPSSTLRPGNARQSGLVGYTQPTRTRSIASAVLRTGCALQG